MECEQALNLISSQIDGELSADDRAALDGHLAACADCRAAAEAMRLQDADLVRAFAPRRRAAGAVADRVVNQLAAERAPRRAWWAPLIASAAAGFLIALLLFRPWQRVVEPAGHETVTVKPDNTPSHGPSIHRSEPNAGAPEPVARLALASGMVEMQAPGRTDWTAMPTGGAITPGTRIRTGPFVRCEFALADGSVVRLNEYSQVLMKSTRNVELARGQVWSSVEKREQPFEVAMADVTVTALGTKFDVLRRPSQTVLTVIEGATRVRSATGMAAEKVVRERQAVSITDGRVGEPNPVKDLENATRWLEEILVMKGRDNEELARRVDDLMAQVGHEKMRLFKAKEIRALGDHCVLPLTRYLQSERSQGDDQARREAAVIISDVAQPQSIPQLIELLEDRDGFVRSRAAVALDRLTGNSMNVSPDDWRDRTPDQLAAARAAWQQWWEKNHETIPGASGQRVVQKALSPPSKG